MKEDLTVSLLENANDSYIKKTKATTEKLYEVIRAEYQKQKSVKKLGVPLYTDQYIKQLLAQKFFKSPRTIDNIIFHRV